MLRYVQNVVANVDNCIEMEDPDKSGGGDVFRMFRRKKKRKMEFLLSCLKQLSLTTEEQTTIIRALTEQNKQHSQDMKHLQETILSTTKEIQKLNDKNSSLVDKLETTESHLLDTEKDLISGREREQILQETKTELSTELRETDKNFGELQTQVEIYQERLNSSEEKNKTLNISVTELKNALKEAKSEHAKLTVRFKLLEKDFSHRKVMAEIEKKSRCDAECKLDNLSKKLDTMRFQEYNVMLDLDAENECLKFDVKKLTDKVKTMKEALNKIRRDKLLIMSYYTQQRGVTAFNNRTPLLNANRFSLDTADGSVIPSTLEAKDEIHPDTLETLSLRNKLMNMEGCIYRREQLIDELVSIIQEYDPDFNVEDQPGLKIYLDDEYNRTDAAMTKTNDQDTYDEQQKKNYSSTSI